MADIEKQSVSSSHLPTLHSDHTVSKPKLISVADLHAAVQEYIGTTVFLLLAYGGVQAGSAGLGDGPPILLTLYASTCFGLSLLASAWVFYRVTGSLFNTNISLALWILGLINTVRFVLYSLAQLAGGITAAALILALTPGPIASK
jgi:aquaporin rerated protein, other eukaryote